MFLEICMQIHFVLFALSRQLNKQKVCENNYLLCAGNKVFYNVKLKGGGLTQKPLAYALASLSPL